MPAASIWAIRPSPRSHQLLGAAADLARLFLEVAARAIEKARRGEMLFKRDGAHGLDAPLPYEMTRTIDPARG
jgi:hypothetical protein